MLICVDFDGTVVDHLFPEVGQPVPGAIDWIKIWQNAGAQIILWTVRSNQPDGNYLDDAVKYLEDNGVELFGINENPEQGSWSTSRKAYAHTYVDDAAFGCPMQSIKGFARPCVDWQVVGPRILSQLQK